MADDDKTPQGFSLKRWSHRKIEATREAATAETPAPAPSVSGPVATPGPAMVPAAEPALPPVESLTSESDFAAFMRPKVDEGLRRQALKKLFADPHFNVMDGLDVYIDDYTKPDPIAPDVLERLMQMGFVRDAGTISVEEGRPEASSPPEAPTPAVPEMASDDPPADTLPTPATSIPASSPDPAAETPAGDESSVPRSR